MLNIDRAFGLWVEALNFLDLFDGRPLPFFLGQCGASHAKKDRAVKPTF